MATREAPSGVGEPELAQLFAEIESYLAAVEEFRREKCEPAWAADESLPRWWLAEHLESPRA